MQCVSPWYYEKTKQMLPCGHCVACRIAKSREWYVRLYHESFYHDNCMFITLTYNDDNLPSDGQLNKEALSAFIKRLRERQETSLKYYCVGEYGDKTGRPHYHGIVYGLEKENELEDSWKKGFTYKGTVTLDSIRYVTDYVFKRLNGDAAEADGRVQPFSLMSKKLGKQYALDNADSIKYYKKVFVKGVELGVPRYYAKVLDIEEEMKEVRDPKEIRSPTNETIVRKKDLMKYGAREAERRQEMRLIQREKNIKSRGSLSAKGVM